MDREIIDANIIKLLVTPRTNNEPGSITHQAVVKILNITLADEAVLGLKTRSAHWNVHGPGFFDRRTLYDVQYKQLNDISDEISKRTRVLNGQPLGSFEEFLQNTRLDEQPGDVPDIIDLLADHETVMCLLREDAKKCLDEHDDEITRDLLVGFLCLHEKMAWLLRSYIEPELSGQERSTRKI